MSGAERQQVFELGVNARTFRLGCTPVVNLFKSDGRADFAQRRRGTITPSSPTIAMRR